MHFQLQILSKHSNNELHYILINFSVYFRPEHLIMESFNSHSEDVKAAASYALGSLAVGNLEKFLPFLLQEITQNPKRQYQLLHALKEVIFLSCKQI